MKGVINWNSVSEREFFYMHFDGDKDELLQNICYHMVIYENKSIDNDMFVTLVKEGAHLVYPNKSYIYQPIVVIIKKKYLLHRLIDYITPKAWAFTHVSPLGVVYNVADFLLFTRCFDGIVLRDIDILFRHAKPCMMTILSTIKFLNMKKLYEVCNILFKTLSIGEMTEICRGLLTERYKRNFMLLIILNVKRFDVDIPELKALKEKWRQSTVFYKQMKIQKKITLVIAKNIVLRKHLHDCKNSHIDLWHMCVRMNIKVLREDTAAELYIKIKAVLSRCKTSMNDHEHNENEARKRKIEFDNQKILKKISVLLSVEPEKESVVNKIRLLFYFFSN